MRHRKSPQLTENSAARRRTNPRQHRTILRDNPAWDNLQWSRQEPSLQIRVGDREERGLRPYATTSRRDQHKSPSSKKKKKSAQGRTQLQVLLSDHRHSKDQIPRKKGKINWTRPGVHGRSIRNIYLMRSAIEHQLFTGRSKKKRVNYTRLAPDSVKTRKRKKEKKRGRRPGSEDDTDSASAAVAHLEPACQPQPSLASAVPAPPPQQPRARHCKSPCCRGPFKPPSEGHRWLIPLIRVASAWGRSISGRPQFPKPPVAAPLLPSPARRPTVADLESPQSSPHPPLGTTSASPLSHAG